MNKLELMNQNKKRYAFVKEHLDDLKTGYDVQVSRLVLAYIKGTKWMGGFSDGQAKDIMCSIIKSPFADEVIGLFDYNSKLIATFEAFEDQMAYWYDRFKKEGI